MTFVIGGAGSGKSAYAETLTGRLPPPWTYIATAEAHDGEMRSRIAAHQNRRDERWATIEAPLDLAGTINTLPPDRPVLIDCLTLWLTNHLLAGNDVENECNQLVSALSATKIPMVVVANEVGMGIVPENAVSRRFRDHAGQLNQKVAAIAGNVVMVVAGIPVEVK